MVSSYKIIKDKILSALYSAVEYLAIPREAIIEAGKENVDVLPIPFVYCDFNYGEAKTAGGTVCLLDTEIYIGCENATLAEAKEEADSIASKILKVLVTEQRLVRILPGERFKEFFAESSQRAGVVLKLKTEISSH